MSQTDTQTNMIAYLLDLIADFIDSDSCTYDHQGRCQAHEWANLARPCPHVRAKLLLDILDQTNGS